MSMTMKEWKTPRRSDDDLHQDNSSPLSTHKKLAHVIIPLWPDLCEELSAGGIFYTAQYILNPAISDCFNHKMFF